jgi:hypothetical protein
MDQGVSQIARYFLQVRLCSFLKICSQSCFEMETYERLKPSGLIAWLAMTKLVCDGTVTEKTATNEEKTKTSVEKRISEMVHYSNIEWPFIQWTSPQAIAQTEMQPSRRLTVLSCSG